MAPPPPTMTALSAAAQFCVPLVICGGALLLLAQLAARASPPASASPSTTGLPPNQLLGLVSLALVALAYLGSLRAAITHQGRTTLGLQTVTIALPSALLAYLVGAHLLSS